nr:reverse transcriptase domain-containing protein [Tanacetum cinerariifolium]
MEERTVPLWMHMLGPERTTIKGKEESRGQADKKQEFKKSKDTDRNLKCKENDKLLEKPLENKPPKKVTPTDMTRIIHFIAEHELKIYPHIEPRVQRKWSIASDRRKVVKDEVVEWFKARIVRRVRYPTWVANPVLVKKPNNSWRMYIDFKDLNEACLKDLYPLLKIDWKIKSPLGFKYKCVTHKDSSLKLTIR